MPWSPPAWRLSCCSTLTWIAWHSCAKTPFGDVNLDRVEVFVGALVAAMLVYLFASLAIRAVGSAASKIIAEVRCQFEENPKIMTGEALPDYARVVDITTRAALAGMIAPGLVPLLGPVD